MNERDSEIMVQTLGHYGFSEIFKEDDADLIIINTCSVRHKAEQKVMSLLGYLRKNKKKKPGLKICVAGCVAQQEGINIIKKMPHVDLVVGTQNIYSIGELLEKKLEGEERVQIFLIDEYVIPKFLPTIPLEKKSQKQSVSDGKERSFSKFVTIMQGCNNFCTYCVVPYTRGRESSRKATDIIEEIESYVELGVKEITLLGQNVNSYGRSNKVHGTAYNFSDLLRDVASISGLARLRFTTSNPKDLTEELMRCFRDISLLCPQFHLPVQAGSDAVLKRMNRNYTIDEYTKMVYKLREYCPSIALTTDIIVGFPGETDSDFELTMDLLNSVRFHGSFSFKYSDRPGTRAKDFINKVDEQVKAERLARFQKRQDEISLERNTEYIGTIKTVLLEKVNSQGGMGRTETNHIVHLQPSPLLSLGDCVEVKITQAGKHSLKGVCEG